MYHLPSSTSPSAECIYLSTTSPFAELRIDRVTTNMALFQVTEGSYQPPVGNEGLLSISQRLKIVEITKEIMMESLDILFMVPQFVEKFVENDLPVDLVGYLLCGCSRTIAIKFTDLQSHTSRIMIKAEKPEPPPLKTISMRTLTGMLKSRDQVDSFEMPDTLKEELAWRLSSVVPLRSENMEASEDAADMEDAEDAEDVETSSYHRCFGPSVSYVEFKLFRGSVQAKIVTI